MKVYELRLKRHLPFETLILPDVKRAGTLPPAELKKKEAQLVLDRLQTSDKLYLLDERGKMYTSEAFAEQLQTELNHTSGRLIFLVGGAFGFDDRLYERANRKLSLSKMTFSHQMVRVFFLEQLYRAMSILRNEPYHNR